VESYATNCSKRENINNFLAVHQTTSSITTFLLTMVLFPEVQKRVQAELDAVVGRKRLPNFEDRASLPYLEATIKESLRFHPPTPLGIAHRLSEDDVVQGKN
jgi:cytochrome P450